MPRYEIDIDRDDTPVATLAALAADADATFTNIAVTGDSNAIFVTLAFDATDADVAAYATFYDADDAITPV